MTIYDFTVKNDKNEDVSLSDYKGKVLLIVNTATQCGLTPQYSGLEDLYKKYADKGLEILDFPCNQFLNQAPGTADEINDFCSINYHTTFPRFAKIDVNGKNASPLYVWLKEQIPQDQECVGKKEFEEHVKEYTPDNGPGDIVWNFGKFLVDRNGNVVARFSPACTPEALEVEIEKVL